MTLQANNVTFTYRGRHGAPVLQNISLTIQSGERVGLKAPSGRGKTTLCRLLAGYERPQSGQVLLDGQPVWGMRGVCPVQMMWQHPETVVDPLLRLGATLEESGPVDRRLLAELHIEDGWMERYPAELSGGELQRFCLARALNPATRFLLCDEISAMLDLVTQAPHPGSRTPGTGAAHRQPQRQPAGAGLHPHRNSACLKCPARGYPHPRRRDFPKKQAGIPQNTKQPRPCQEHKRFSDTGAAAFVWRKAARHPRSCGRMGGVALIYIMARCMGTVPVVASGRSGRGLIGCLLLTGRMPSHGQGTVNASSTGAPVSLAAVYTIRFNFEKGIETF